MGEYLCYLASRGNERPGLMVYFDLLDQLEEGEYTKEEAGELFLAFLRYGRYGEMPTFRDRGLKALWHEARRKIDRDGEGWERKVMGTLYATYARECKADDPEASPLSKEAWIDREMRTFNCAMSTERNEPSTERNEPSTERSQQEQGQEPQLTARNENKKSGTTPAPAELKQEQEGGDADCRGKNSGNARGGEKGGGVTLPARNTDDQKDSFPKSFLDLFDIPSFKEKNDAPLH